MSDFNQELAMSLLQVEEEYPVSLDDAWQWLGYAKKHNAKEKLVNNFEEGIDYVIPLPQEREFRPQGGFSNREDIYLTVDCFKQLGMMAGTSKGKEVRRYFINCEKQLKNQMQQTNQLIISEQVVLQLSSFIAEQRALNSDLMERTKKLDDLNHASTTHKGARAVIDAELNEEYSEEDGFVSVDQYLLSIGLIEVESTAKNAIKRRAAGFYRADKHKEPKKVKGRNVFVGADIEYVRQAVKSVLNL